MKITRAGLDIAKEVFEVHGVDEHGKVGVRKQLRRSRVLEYFAKIEPCLIGMETGSGAHYWARELTKLRPPQAAAAELCPGTGKGGGSWVGLSHAVCSACTASRVVPPRPA